MGQELEKSNPPTVPSGNVLNLSALTQIDMSGIPADQVAELRRQFASGMLDLTKKAQELKIDNASLSMILDTFNTEASKATQSNVSMTATHTQTTAIGRTEVVIGNTDRAASGRLSSSATGMQDRTLLVVGVLAVAAIIIALIVAKA